MNSARAHRQSFVFRGLQLEFTFEAFFVGFEVGDILRQRSTEERREISFRRWTRTIREIDSHGLLISLKLPHQLAFQNDEAKSELG
jgi:hypothetical protein